MGAYKFWPEKNLYRINYVWKKNTKKVQLYSLSHLKTHLQQKTCDNIVEKGGIVWNKQFLLLMFFKDIQLLDIIENIKLWQKDKFLNENFAKKEGVSNIIFYLSLNTIIFF